MQPGIKRKLNHMLQSNGLGRLDAPGTMSQMGYLVRDHEHLRELLTACVPEERGNMYETLRPNLRFKAHPLDVYLSQAAQEADAKKLPAWDGEKFIPYRDYERKATQAITKDMILAAKGGTLKVVCAKCTVEASFVGLTVVSAAIEARKAGWVYDREAEQETCPKCASTRPTNAPNSASYPLVVN